MNVGKHKSHYEIIVEWEKREFKSKVYLIVKNGSRFCIYYYYLEEKVLNDSLYHKYKANEDKLSTDISVFKNVSGGNIKLWEAIGVCGKVPEL